MKSARLGSASLACAARPVAGPLDATACASQVPQAAAPVLVAAWSAAPLPPRAIAEGCVHSKVDSGLLDGPQIPGELPLVDLDSPDGELAPFKGPAKVRAAVDTAVVPGGVHFASGVRDAQSADSGGGTAGGSRATSRCSGHSSYWSTGSETLGPPSHFTSDEDEARGSGGGSKCASGHACRESAGDEVAAAEGVPVDECMQREPDAHAGEAESYQLGATANQEQIDAWLYGDNCSAEAESTYKDDAANDGTLGVQLRAAPPAKQPEAPWAGTSLYSDEGAAGSVGGGVDVAQAGAGAAAKQQASCSESSSRDDAVSTAIATDDPNVAEQAALAAEAPTPGQGSAAGSAEPSAAQWAGNGLYSDEEASAHSGSRGGDVRDAAEAGVTVARGASSARPNSRQRQPRSRAAAVPSQATSSAATRSKSAHAGTPAQQSRGARKPPVSPPQGSAAQQSTHASRQKQSQRAQRPFSPPTSPPRMRFGSGGNSSAGTPSSPWQPAQRRVRSPASPPAAAHAAPMPNNHWQRLGSQWAAHVAHAASGSAGRGGRRRSATTSPQRRAATPAAARAPARAPAAQRPPVATTIERSLSPRAGVRVVDPSAPGWDAAVEVIVPRSVAESWVSGLSVPSSPVRGSPGAHSSPPTPPPPPCASVFRSTSPRRVRDEHAEVTTGGACSADAAPDFVGTQPAGSQGWITRERSPYRVATSRLRSPVRSDQAPQVQMPLASESTVSRAASPPLRAPAEHAAVPEHVQLQATSDDTKAAAPAEQVHAQAEAAMPEVRQSSRPHPEDKHAVAQSEQEWLQGPRTRDEAPTVRPGLAWVVHSPRSHSPVAEQPMAPAAGQRAKSVNRQECRSPAAPAAPADIWDAVRGSSESPRARGAAPANSPQLARSDERGQRQASPAIAALAALAGVLAQELEEPCGHRGRERTRAIDQQPCLNVGNANFAGATSAPAQRPRRRSRSSGVSARLATIAGAYSSVSPTAQRFDAGRSPEADLTAQSPQKGGASSGASSSSTQLARGASALRSLLAATGSSARVPVSLCPAGAELNATAAEPQGANLGIEARDEPGLSFFSVQRLSSEVPLATVSSAVQRLSSETPVAKVSIAAQSTPLGERDALATESRGDSHGHSGSDVSNAFSDLTFPGAQCISMQRAEELAV
jgi:hypothetical protein